MEIKLSTIAVGQHLDRKTAILIGRKGNTEININVENGNGIVSELSKNGYGYDYHRPIYVKEMDVVVTGNDLRDGECVACKMTPLQIYKLLHDGFTVAASGF